ncbi:MAG: hypothetical protein ACOH2T_18975 [Pseudomonas sp.]
MSNAIHNSPYTDTAIDGLMRAYRYELEDTYDVLAGELRNTHGAWFDFILHGVTYYNRRGEPVNMYDPTLLHFVDSPADAKFTPKVYRVYDPPRKARFIEWLKQVKEVQRDAQIMQQTLRSIALKLTFRKPNNPDFLPDFMKKKTTVATRTAPSLAYTCDAEKQAVELYWGADVVRLYRNIEDRIFFYHGYQLL